MKTDANIPLKSDGTGFFADTEAPKRDWSIFAVRETNEAFLFFDNYNLLLPENNYNVFGASFDFSHQVW